MKKIFAILIVSLVSVCAFAQKTLVDSEAYIQNQQGLYWKFTVPYDSDYVTIDCNTSAEWSWKMYFAVTRTYEDAVKFTAGKSCMVVSGSEKGSAQDYYIKLELSPGKTYYFVAFNNTLGITAAKQYKIKPKIISYPRGYTNN